MLEFIFKDENFTENYPLVVVVGDDWRADIKRLGYLNESEKGQLADGLEKCHFNAEKHDIKTLALGHRYLVVACWGKNFNFIDFDGLAAGIYAKASCFRAVEIIWNKSAERDENTIAAGLALALEKAAYRFDKYQTQKKAEDFPELETVSFPLLKKPVEWREVTALANAVRYARDLGNEPPNILTPEVFALDIKRLEYLELKVELLDWDYIRRNKLGLIEAVARGSVNKTYVAVMQWCGKPKQKEWDLGLVGKGVTYDSGGITLKTDSQQIGEKKDMCGAASVVAAMKAAALQKLPLNLIAVLPLVENMPAPNAYKPDDVVTSLSGQTVEIVDTDGEGRLILADALWLIQEKYKVKTVVDMATLTGSTAYIFGGFYAGLLGNDVTLMSQIKEAARQSGEKVWELPMEEKIGKWLKSEIADMKQLGKKEADSTQAACFLQRYIQKGTCWAHIDIAGCETDKKGMATGYGVVLLDKLFKTRLMVD